MPQYAYASVGVSLTEFMAGKNPTTQPGVQVPYYTSFAEAMANVEYEFDGKDSASCVMMFEVSEVKTKLTPSPNPTILGRGTINPQHIVDAMIQVKRPGQDEPMYIDAGKCDWDKARSTIQLIQDRNEDRHKLEVYHDFMKTALTWNDRHVSDIANHIFQGYVRQQIVNTPFGTPTDINAATHMHMYNEFVKAYQQASSLTEQARIVTSMEAAYKVIEPFVRTTEMRHENIYGLTPEQPDVSTAEAFYNEQLHQPLDSEGVFSHQEANLYAALQLSVIPNTNLRDLREIATNAFNAKLCAIAVENPEKFFDAKDITTAVAYAWQEMQKHVPHYDLELQALAMQGANRALLVAIKAGATPEEITAEPNITLKTDVGANETPGNPNDGVPALDDLDDLDTPDDH